MNRSIAYCSISSKLFVEKDKCRIRLPALQNCDRIPKDEYLQIAEGSFGQQCQMVILLPVHQFPDRFCVLYVIHVCVKKGLFNHFSAKIYNHIAVQNILKVRQAYDFIYPARIERIAQLIIRSRRPAGIVPMDRPERMEIHFFDLYFMQTFQKSSDFSAEYVFRNGEESESIA